MLGENNWLCVFQALSFPFQGGFPGGGGSLICIYPLPHTFDPYWSKPLLFISSLAPQHTHVYFTKPTHQDP